MTGETVVGLRERALRMRNALALELPAPVWVDVADIVDRVLTRLATAEADADRLAKMLQRRDDGVGIDWVDDEALCLHEALVALRNPS